MMKRTAICVLLAMVFLGLSSGPSAAVAQVRIKEKPLPTRPPAESMRAEYIIKAWDFYSEGKNYGFNVNCHSLSFGSLCNFKKTDDADIYFEAGTWGTGQLLGSRCDFTVFEPAQLKNGFVFKSFKGYALTATKARMEVKSSPSPGSTSVKIVLHGWAEAGQESSYRLQTLTLEGPAGRDWKDAIR